MPPQTPYTNALGDREPVAAMRGTADRYRQLLAGWTPAQFERTIAPGKWTARQIMIHLAQTELALGNRARMALATPNYAAQAFNQDDWMAKEQKLEGKNALDAFLRHLPQRLRPGGRVAILTFHSGEDRRVKKSFEAGLRDGSYSEIAPEVIRPTAAERNSNPRSASAKLRWARKAIVL